VSGVASIVGIALVVNAVFATLEGRRGDALMDAGLGLYCCVWAFVPYDEFFRVAGRPIRFRNNEVRRAYDRLFPFHLKLLMFLAAVLMISGLLNNVVSALR
jgi:hypothetical protein